MRRRDRVFRSPQYLKWSNSTTLESPHPRHSRKAPADLLPFPHNIRTIISHKHHFPQPPTPHHVHPAAPPHHSSSPYARVKHTAGKHTSPDGRIKSHRIQLGKQIRISPREGPPPQACSQMTASSSGKNVSGNIWMDRSFPCTKMMEVTKSLLSYLPLPLRGKIPL